MYYCNVLYHSPTMNENERDFKKVLESIKSLESQIIELNLYVREQIKHLLEENKKDIIYQHKINLDDKQVIGQILDLISVHTDQIEEIKAKIND